MKIPISVTTLSLALVCLLSVMLMTQIVAASGDGACKELSKQA